MRIWLLLLAALSLSLPAQAADSDLDGVDDLVDNCPFVANPRVIPALPGQTTVGGQPDDDLDGMGNACDCDFTGDGFCNVDDFNGFIGDFISGRPSAGSGTDMTGDGFVNIDDFLRFVVGFQSGFPGPSCGPACDALELGCSGPECPAGPNAACAAAADALCVDRDFVAADDLLANCLAGLNVDDPGVPPAGSGLTFGAATGFRGLTRALRPFFEQPTDADPGTIDRISELLDVLGFPAGGRDPLEWLARRGDGPAGVFPSDTCVVPEGTLDASDFQMAIATDVLPALDRALAELAAVEALLPVWDGSCDMPSDFGPPMTIEFDETDSLALRATLHFLRGFFLWWASFDAEVDLELACETVQLGPLGGIEQLLSDYPSLLTFRDGNDKALPALDDFLWSAALAKAALDSALAEPDDQTDDFLSVVFDTPEDEQAMRDRLQRIEDSLVGPTHFPNLGLCGDPLLDAGAFFEVAPRDLIPPYMGNEPLLDSIADPTFGGVLSPFSADDLVCSLDDEPPFVEITAIPGPNGGFGSVDLEIRATDVPMGGAGIESSTWSIYLSAWTMATSVPCPITVDGVPAATGFGLNTANLFTASQRSDASELLSGQVALDESCSLLVFAEASDRNGNKGATFSSLFVFKQDLRTSFDPSPRSFPGLVAPFDLQLQIVAEDGTPLDPDNRRIRAGHLGCSDLSLGGVHVPPGINDVTSLFAEDGNPQDDVRTMVTTVDLLGDGFCLLQFCIDHRGVDGDFELEDWGCQSFGIQ